MSKKYTTETVMGTVYLVQRESFPCGGQAEISVPAAEAVQAALDGQDKEFLLKRVKGLEKSLRQEKKMRQDAEIFNTEQRLVPRRTPLSR